MSSQNIYDEIIRNIMRLYDAYEERANKLSDEHHLKLGAKKDENERTFLNKLIGLEKDMQKLLNQMRKDNTITKDHGQSLRVVSDCLQAIKNIIKKKNLLFKINNQMNALLDETVVTVQGINSCLKGASDTSFLCCGGGGAKKFKQAMTVFANQSAKWQIASIMEPKDSMESFISPKFSEKQYSFIAEILKKKWPQQKIVQIIKTVPSGKPTILNTANQYIYGINKQPNPAYGLKIYHDEAQKNGNPVASAYLGSVYQDGVLLPKDLDKAQRHFKKAKESGQPYGAYRYALTLIVGDFVNSGQNYQDIQKGYNILNQLVNGSQPCPEALTELGEIHQLGSFEADHNKLLKVPKDLRKAIDYYNKAISLNLPRAANNLGTLYYNNKYLNERSPNQTIQTEANARQNQRKAIKYLEQAQRQGFGQAYYNLAVIYSTGFEGKTSEEECLRLLYEGGIKGDDRCRVRFAYELMSQTSVWKEQYGEHYEIAIHWLESVILGANLKEKQTHNSTFLERDFKRKRQAYYYLGLIYQYGFGVQKNPHKAFSYFIQSSDLQFASAKNKTGDCYYSGFGTKKDYKLAIGFYLQAAQLKNSQAMVNLGTIYLNGVNNVVDCDYHKAYTYFCLAMDEDNSDAMVHLSNMYRNGLGLDVDETIAVKLLKNAANKGKNSTAQYILSGSQTNYHNGSKNSSMTNKPSKLNIKNIVPLVSELK